MQKSSSSLNIRCTLLGLSCQVLDIVHGEGDYCSIELEAKARRAARLLGRDEKSALVPKPQSSL